jgi:TPP-dependent pyruvate/acetoin dehydrogenase alpha subunit
MAEMFAKDTGCCRGLGGSMHIADFRVGMLGANGIVAGGIPHAVGAAWSAQYLKDGRVAVAFFGDGAANEGVFHESLNLAAVWRLPVVFVCENNLYGFSTHYRRVTAVEDIAARAASYAMPGRVADGMDAQAVYEAAGQAVGRARRGEGPSLLECKTYRFRGHSRFEPAGYRTREELEAWRARDPLPAWRKRLAGQWRVPEDELSAVEEAADREIAAAVAFAESGPDPDPAAYRRYIFAEG